MKTMDITNATAPLVQYARQLGHEPLVLTDGDEPVAALMPIDDADLESLALGTNPKFLAMLDKARAQRHSGVGLSADEVRRELGLS
jgi:antitoxin (DNA-binding transcriptional repressor) of toxin-antitoxin stability system